MARSNKVEPVESFQPTYEELKLGEVGFAVAGESRFQPTYEELKLLSLCQQQTFRQSFQPTYEELKRATPLLTS